MSSLHFPPWSEQQNIFNLSCADAETYNQLSNVDNPVPQLQHRDTDLGSKKMAIPRLAEGAESAFTSPGRFHRRHVRRACESCRQRKTKCTGDKSGCRNCREAGIICCYTDGKREKSKRQLASLSAKVQAYEDVISKLSNRFGVSDEQLVNIALAAAKTNQESAPDVALNPDASITTGGDQKFILWRSGSEPPPSRASSVSPLESGDQTEEDFNRDETARATGFIGKSSEITWLQRLSKEVNNECEAWPATLLNTDDVNGLPSPTLTPRPENPSDPWVVCSNYYVDDMDIPTADHGDAYAVPSREPATKLLNVYLTSVHPSFPIIGISTFVSQFQVFFSQPALKPGNKWLAILNMIFAIASKYGQLTYAEWLDEEDDHQMYFSRARALSLENQILHHPDLQQLQVEGLTSFYLTGAGHINRAGLSRAWKLSGIAIRGALALGLHLRNVGASTSDTSKEIRYRVWWSLYTLEHLLTVMTGRPSCVIDSSCTTPMPVPYDESDFQKGEVARLIRRSSSMYYDQMPASNSGEDRESTAESESNDAPAESDIKMNRAEYLKSLPPCISFYFLQLSSLTSISKRMTVKLYSPEALQSPWASTEFTIQSLMLEIDSWFMNLPQPTISLQHRHHNAPSTSHQNRHHPTMSVSPETSGIRGRQDIRVLQQNCRRVCRGRVPHAHAVPRFTRCSHAIPHVAVVVYPPLPDAGSYSAPPGIGISRPTRPRKRNHGLQSREKALDWLSSLSKTSLASERAWRLCDGFLRRLAPHIGISVNDLPSHEECAADTLFPDTADPMGMAEDPIGDLSLNPLDPCANLPTTAAVDAIATELDPITCSPIDQSDSSIGVQEPYGLEAPDFLDQFIKQEMDITDRSPYDEYFPYDPTTGQITGSFFPSGNLDLDMGYFWGDPVC
ncbi:hypothetical protein N7522_009507 [Penicillium canescens]|nr:hypothetical protein N7522_009507 [Penicillium canescens]KAJ6054807.1 hypothetical protein N7444_003905 [Penicillium canescens]